VLATTGYEVGTVPPFGHHQPVPTLVDRRVLEQETVYAGGGGHRVLLRFSPGEILRVTAAETIDLHGQA
jgi:prolyl-tRNA editing enzyme YbaK/EbsC (Cys-tRNA(Pro) deacylase)